MIVSGPQATDEQIAHAKPFADAFPELAQSIKRSHKYPKVSMPKEAVTLRLDPEVVSRFKKPGRG